MAVSRDTYKKAQELVKSSERILICVNNRSSLDTHVAAAALYHHLKATSKNVSVCVNGEMILKHKLLFEELGVPCEVQLKPLSYVVALDHGAGDIEGVSYDDRNGTFYLYITPVSGAKGFDFKKVKFSQGGGDFDLIVTFGVRTLSWLGPLHDENKDLFAKATSININNLPGTQEHGTLTIVDTELSVSELVYDMIEGVSSAMSSSIADMLLMGLLEHLQIVQRSDYKISSVERLADLVRTGADLKKAFKNLYYERDTENFEVVRKSLNNLKTDVETGFAWSSVSAFDLARSGVTRENFILDGRIIFNVCRDFKAACVLYEVQEGEVLIEFETNLPDLDAKELLSSYKLAGTAARVFGTVRNKALADIEQEILETVTPVLQSAGKEEVENPLQKTKPEGGQSVLRTPPEDASVPEPTVASEKEHRHDEIGESDDLTPKPETGDNTLPSLPDETEEAKSDAVTSSDAGLVTPPPISPETP